MAKETKVERFEPDLDFSSVYYEGESPTPTMIPSKNGDWVQLSDYLELEKKYKELKDVLNK